MNARGPVALRPLAALTAVVVAAHLLVLQQAPTALNFGEAPPGRASALTTRTVAPPAPVPPAPAAVATPAPRPQPAKAPPAPKTAKPPATPSAAPLMPVDASNQAYTDVNDVELATPSGVNGTTTSPVSPGAPASAEVVVAAATPSSAPAAPAVGGVTLSATAPAPVRVLYNVTGQARNLPYSARAELLWRHDGRHYDARMEVSAFLVGSRTQTSEGDITPQGLAPRRFGDKSRNELEAARRGVGQGTRVAYFGVQSGLAQVRALEAAEASTKLALEATQLGYKVGVRVNLDVLNAQSQLFTTQRDLAKARYDVVMGSLKLRQAAGQLAAPDVEAANRLLAK